MPRPEVGETAELMYEALAPLAIDDEANGWPLLLFCDGFTTGTLEDVHEIVSDRDEQPGWVILLDPDNTPAAMLPYLGQFVGVELAPSDSEADRRAKIKLPSGFRRGTLASLVAAVAATLTGSKAVLIAERFEDSAYKLWVRTYAPETPDPAKTEAAVLTQKPIGIVLTYDAITGQSYSDLEAAHTDYDDVEATYDDYNDVRFTLPPP